MRRLILAISIFFSTACGGGEPMNVDDQPQQPEQPEQPDQPDQPNQPDQPTPSFELAGVWALEVTVGQILKSPLGEAPTTVTTRSLVRAETSGSGATLASRMCSIELSPYQGATTTYPPATIEAMSSTGVRANFTGSSFEVPPHAELLGWRAGGDAMTEDIPADDSDPRVIDVDGDGHPGATVSVMSSFASGDVYVVSRAIQSLEGTVVSADRIEGRSEVEMEQEVVGASSALLTFGSVMSRPDPDPNVNTFVMVRLDAQADCAAVERGLR